MPYVMSPTAISTIFFVFFVHGDLSETRPGR